MDISHLTYEPQENLLELVSRIEQRIGRIGIEDFPQGPRMPPGRFERDGPTIYLRHDAGEEVLAHEILHADLYARGFPGSAVNVTYDHDDATAVRRVKCLGECLRELGNCLDHVLMYPTFVALGYRGEKFVGLGDAGGHSRFIRDLKHRLQTAAREFRDDVELGL